MTAPEHPMPAAGGTYMRDPVTGALTEVVQDPETGAWLPVAQPDSAADQDHAGGRGLLVAPEETYSAAPPVTEAADPGPAPAKGRKTPVKEG